MNLHRCIPFVPAKDYYRSSAFYQAMGFTQLVIAQSFSEFKSAHHSFYLQDYYVPALAENMIFELHVDNIETFFGHMLGVLQDFKEAKLSDLTKTQHGNTFTIADPCGVTWVVKAANTF